MRRIFKYFLILVVLLAVLALGTAAGVYYWAARGLPTIEKIADYNPALTTTIYSRGNETLGYLSRENRFLRSKEQMTEDVRRAFLASEDSGFYEHGAIDLMGILRAAIKNLRAGEIVQGGSTITQQVVKSLLLTPTQSYKRKLKEAILAYRLEKHLSKDEILTIYLNQIYLGEGAYGVEAASRVYFDKHADELTLAESALLAGLPKGPAHFNPVAHPEPATPSAGSPNSPNIRMGSMLMLLMFARPMALNGVVASPAPRRAAARDICSIIVIPPPAMIRR